MSLGRLTAFLPKVPQFLVIEMCPCRDEAFSRGWGTSVPPAWPVGSVHLGKIDDVIPSRDDATKVRVKCLIGMSGAGAWLCCDD